MYTFETVGKYVTCVRVSYRVATISKIDKMIGLFSKRAL